MLCVEAAVLRDRAKQERKTDPCDVVQLAEAIQYLRCSSWSSSSRDRLPVGHWLWKLPLVPS